MKITRLFFVFLSIATLAGGILSACHDAEAKAQADNQPASMTQEQLVARGDYLVNAIGCDDCHSPKKLGSQGPELILEKRFSGFPQDGVLPEYDQEVLKSWALFNGDLTAAIGPSKGTDEISRADDAPNSARTSASFSLSLESTVAIICVS